jgi:hypothetical protein
MFGHRDDSDDDKAVETAAPDEQAVKDTAEDTTPEATETKDDTDDKSADKASEEATTAEPAEVIEPDAEEPTETAPAVDADDKADAPADETDAPEADDSDQVPTDTDDTWQHPGEPLNKEPEPISDVIYPAGLPKPPSFRPGPDEPADNEDNSTNELIDIKMQVLNELSPLVDELDQNPEDKFRTLMMMIQASDNQDLVKQAYAAAHTIEDEKTRAQALLDIVNEINYFTQSHHLED